MRRLFRILALLLPATAAAQDFHLAVTETPVGSGTDQIVQRYRIAGSGGAATSLGSIPIEMTDDPASGAFRTPQELFIGNRAGHSGNGSISMVIFDSSFDNFIAGPRLLGNQVTDVHQIAFNPVDGELFATNYNTGVVSRFQFDAAGNASPNGTLSMPDGHNQLGIVIREADQQLFVSSYTEVRRFSRNPDGSYSHIGNLSIPGGSLIHFMKFRGDELYVCDLTTNAVYRYLFDASGNPVPNGSVAGSSPVDVGFSPDGLEMFAPNHLTASGMDRFLYDAGTDTWNYTSTFPGPKMGGVAIATPTNDDSFLFYGDGCPGTNGLVPGLAGLGVAGPGDSITVVVAGGQPNAQTLLMLATDTAQIPLPGGCTFLLGGTLLGPPILLPLDASGNLRLPVAIPPVAQPGATLSFQVLCEDPGAGNGRYTLTNGVTLRIQ